MQLKIVRYKKSIIALLLVTIMVFGGVTAYADEFVITPFTIESEDGSRVFIFTPPFHPNDSYLATGVYYNTEPLELIYLVENIGEGGFVFSSDFKHLAFFSGGPWGGIGFYENGILLKRYRIEDLVENMDLVRFYTASVVIWKLSESTIFNSANNTLTITTVDNLTYVFDITTGEIIENNRPGFQYFILVLSGIGVVVCITVFFVIRNHQKNKNCTH